MTIPPKRTFANKTNAERTTSQGHENKADRKTSASMEA